MHSTLNTDETVVEHQKRRDTGDWIPVLSNMFPKADTQADAGELDGG